MRHPRRRDGGALGVSIPSSSGRGRRHASTWRHRGIYMKFQSPLRRGGVGDVPIHTHPPGHIGGFQSPLRRGGVGDCSSSVSGRSSPACFNPLFVGEGSATRLRRGVGNPRRRGFNPLFVGEGSATSREAAQHGAHGVSIPSSSGRGRRPFQVSLGAGVVVPVSIPSSSGRGRRPLSTSYEDFNTCEVSIPSSSGRGRRLANRWWSLRAAAPGFNPLFVGEGSATPTKAPNISCCSGDVSIPSSSGRGRRPGRRGQQPRPDAGFNPLFVGEGSATPARHGGRRPQPDVSIPSSSGRGRRHRCWAGCSPEAGFNPLFVGEGSATGRWSRSHPPAARRVSIPSSSGRGRRRTTTPPTSAPCASFNPLFVGEGSATSA